MSSKSITQRGGANVVSNDATLSVYFSISRGASNEDIKSMVDTMVTQSQGDVEKIVDIFALWMHTRDARGGKGERLIAEEMCFALLKYYPQTTVRLIRMIPAQYGSWKDITSIIAKLLKKEEEEAMKEGNEELLKNEALSLYRDHLLNDATSEKPSLAGKWAPREKGKDSAVAKLLASYCFPGSKTPRKDYRQLISGLNTKLSTPEVMMCAHEWSKINPSAIPSKCLTSNRKAFLNEKKKGNGVRFPEDEDRIECSNKMKEALSAKAGSKNGVHGAATQPHELVKDYINQLLDIEKQKRNGTNIFQFWKSPEIQEVNADLVVEAQWKDLVERLRKDLGEGLEQLVPIADMSTDEGLLPAVIAHAILAAECAPPGFRNRVLTFAEKPKWINLELNNEKDSCDSNVGADEEKQQQKQAEGVSLLSKVRLLLGERFQDEKSSVKDLEAAVKMMLQVCQASSLPADTVSSLRLLVLSDMQFETAWVSTGLGPWTTQYESLCQQFQQAGYPHIPEVVYWSVASKSLAKGERFQLPGLGNSLELELSSDSSSILCGACLAYDSEGQYVDTSCYTMRSACGGALKHSGDTLVDGKSKHRIGVDLKKLPEQVDQLFFSLCACGPSDLSAFQRPYINLTDGVTRGNLCRYDLNDAGKSPSALMAAVVKVPGGGWAITALGDDAKTKCCGDYSEMKQMCTRRIPDVGVTAGSASSLPLLPVASETPGVRLLCGFSADMLRCLIVSEEEKAALVMAEEAENKAKQAREAASAAALEADIGDEAALEVARKANEVAEAAETEAVEAKAYATSPVGKLRIILRGERYQAVREAVAEIGEKDLAGYVAAADWVKV